MKEVKVDFHTWIWMMISLLAMSTCAISNSIDKQNKILERIEKKIP